MKILRFISLLFIGFIYSNSGFTQNIIPNPGFENVFTPLNHQWVQPQGPFYHYEKDQEVNRIAHSGNYYNGICMYNNEPNEYLHVKLLDKLNPSQRYRFSVFVKLYTIKAYNFKAQDRIGVHFGKKLLDTQIPGDLYFDPQLILFFPDSADRFQWLELTGEYLATGEEEFMTIGFFPELQNQLMREKNKEEYWENITRRYETKEKNISKNNDWLYLPPDEQKKYLKKLKKEKKKTKKDVLAIPLSSYQPLPKEKPENPYEFIVRYYFDDFCLSPVDSLGNFNCTGEKLQESFEVGEIITLKNIFFQTAEDVLLKESFVQLNELVSILKNHPDMKIKINGHTDKVGDEEFNLDLSERRAKSVIEYLKENGIEKERLQSRGYGFSKPVADNETEAGRALNRRVEFVIIEQ